MLNESLFSSNKDYWETPQQFFDELDKEFHFTLDAASTKENAKCPKFYTKEDDALSLSWEGETVFCNPPYGREIKKWVKKCYEEGQRTTVVLLIPSRTDTSYFHDYLLDKAEIRFLRGRLKFELEGKPRDAAPFPSLVAVFRPHHD